MSDPNAEDLIAQLDDDRTREYRLGEARRLAQIKQLRALLSAQQLREDTLKVVAELCPLVSPPPEPEPFRARTGRPPHTWVLLFSDLQLGQKSRLEASNYLFEQTTEIALAQVRQLWWQLEALYRHAREDQDVTELVILDLGDNHEGDSMRVSQAAHVDQPVAVQFVDCFDITAWLVNQALALFPRVRYLRVGGNHDRFSPKPGPSGLDQLDMRNTFAWIGGEMLRRTLSPAIERGRLRLVNHESWFGADVIAGQRFVYEHGASFRSSTGSYGGISYYSIANQAGRYAQMLGGADVVAFGHFHQPMRLPIRGGWGWQVVNGAFPPSSEFVQAAFKGFNRPCQLLLDFEDGVGLACDRPLYLETEHMAKPGDFWARVGRGD
jgi:predicted phosphodiesterase